MPRPRPRHRVLACLLPLALTLFGWFAILVLVGFAAGCGDGWSQSATIPAPVSTPAADLSLSLSSTAVSVAQGGTSSPLTITVSPQNSFSGTVSFIPVNVPGYGPTLLAATSTPKVFVACKVSPAHRLPAAPASLSWTSLLPHPPVVLPAPQPQVPTLTGSPLLQADAAGDKVFLAFDAAHGGPVALWNSSSPNDFTKLAANQSPTDVAISADGQTFAAI